MTDMDQLPLALQGDPAIGHACIEAEPPVVNTDVQPGRVDEKDSDFDVSESCVP